MFAHTGNSVAVVVNMRQFVKTLTAIVTVPSFLSLSGGFTFCWHPRPSSGREHTVI